MYGQTHVQCLVSLLACGLEHGKTCEVKAGEGLWAMSEEE